jgi:hypothetical protein
MFWMKRDLRPQQDKPRRGRHSRRTGPRSRCTSSPDFSDWAPSVPLYAAPLGLDQLATANQWLAPLAKLCRCSAAFVW